MTDRTHGAGFVTSGAFQTLATQNVTPDINVYFVRALNSLELAARDARRPVGTPARVLSGITYSHDINDPRMVILADSGDGTVLAHEIGHAIGLSDVNLLNYETEIQENLNNFTQLFPTPITDALARDLMYQGRFSATWLSGFQARYARSQVVAGMGAHTLTFSSEPIQH
jgi:hypothetical protein